MSPIDVVLGLDDSDRSHCVLSSDPQTHTAVVTVVRRGQLVACEHFPNLDAALVAVCQWESRYTAALTSGETHPATIKPDS